MNRKSLKRKAETQFTETQSIRICEGKGSTKNEYYDYSTPSEKKFLMALVPALVRSGVQLEVHCNQEYFFKKSRLISHLKDQNKLDMIGPEYVEDLADIYYRKLDIFIPRVNLVIEVNGGCHDRINEKIEKDKILLESLASLNIEVFTVQNEDLNTSKNALLLINTLVPYITELYKCTAQKKRHFANKSYFSKNRKNYRFSGNLRNSPRGVSYHHYNFTKVYSGHLRNLCIGAYLKYGGVTYPINLSQSHKSFSKLQKPKT